MVRVSLIFCMVFCGLVTWGSSVDPRRKYWGEKLITHEAGKSPKESRVLCFDTGLYCGFVNRWFFDEKVEVIQIKIVFEVVDINYRWLIKDLSTHYRIEKRNFINVKLLKNPLEYNKCILVDMELQCSYFFNINVFGDGITENAVYPPVKKCFQKINGIEKNKTCREMMQELLPFEKHRSTNETCATNNKICKKNYISLPITSI